ncbi:MAG: HDOD domain-containing protein [Phycisphaerae bacterium]|nr:HDOD domain-containing protein [Phycisphaerae bacterium]
MAASSLKRRKVELLLDGVERLPTLPGVAQHLLALLVSAKSAPREIQQVLESDAALAARVLQLAVHFGHAPTPESITIQGLLRTVGLEEIAADLLSVDIVDAEVLRRGRLVRLWKHNLATAMAAQVVAARLGTVPPDQALLAGLLHDLGHVALPVLMPKAFGQVIERVEAGGADFLEVERELAGMDHAVLGKQLAQRWGFPEAIQNVIWLHHQANIPVEQSGAGPLIRVVRLADLIARQEGFGYHPSEQIRDNAQELAERLGLAGAQTEAIGQQVADAIGANIRAVGMEDEPTPGQLWRLVSAANRRLGGAYRAVSDQRREVQVQFRRADLLIRLNGRLADCHSSREVLETIAETACEVLGLRLVVPYLLARSYEYVEGVSATGEGGIEHHFLYEVSQSETLRTLLSEDVAPLGGVIGPVRAERVEAWLFERLGERLGAGPFYTVAMVVEGVKIGGIVFALAGGKKDTGPQETAELVALANLAGVALKRAQAEADLVALSEELAEANRELTAAQEARLQQRNVASLSEMAAGAAHEINNPLAVISGRAQQLLGPEQDAARRQMLESIVEQSDRISDIIGQLRRFARPPRPQPETVDPAALVRSVADDCRAELEGTPVTVTIEAHKAVPAVRVDPGQVAEALREVVRNGIEACARGGTCVTILVQPLAAEDAVRIAVVDDGPGMSPHVRARAFDPFYCGYEAGRHRGMGLPKAFRAVEANGGQMALESTPGQGTTVRITFPAAAEKPAP